MPREQPPRWDCSSSAPTSSTKRCPCSNARRRRGSDDSWVQIAYGRALIARLGEQPDPSATEALLQQARTVLSRAVELDADSAYAAGMLGYVELMSGADLPRATILLERAVRLAPSREQYRLFLAQALTRQRELEKATAQIGPLVASARDPRLRAQARELLAQIAELRNLSAAPAAALPPAPDREALANLSRLAVETPSPPGTPNTRGPAQPLATLRPDLRPVGAGETRVLGEFRAIDCVQGSIVLVVQTESGPLLLRARQIGDVDFISYRSDTPGSVSCGPLARPQRVLATYRANATGSGASATAGDAVAIELLPDNY